MVPVVYLKKKKGKGSSGSCVFMHRILIRYTAFKFISRRFSLFFKTSKFAQTKTRTNAKGENITTTPNTSLLYKFLQLGCCCCTAAAVHFKEQKRERRGGTHSGKRVITIAEVEGSPFSTSLIFTMSTLSHGTKPPPTIYFQTRIFPLSIFGKLHLKTIAADRKLIGAKGKCRRLVLDHILV